VSEGNDFIWPGFDLRPLARRGAGKYLLRASATEAVPWDPKPISGARTSRTSSHDQKNMMGFGLAFQVTMVVNLWFH